MRYTVNIYWQQIITTDRSVTFFIVIWQQSECLIIAPMSKFVIIASIHPLNTMISCSVCYKTTLKNVTLELVVAG